jgi:hypothetical protein
VRRSELGKFARFFQHPPGLGSGYARAVPGFPKPRFRYSIDVQAERGRLRQHKAARRIPNRQRGKLLLATWNIANLGAREQKRDPACFDLLAEIIGWFDLVAVQEVRDDVDAGIRQIHERLPRSWDLIFSETGGNDEKMAFLWDTGEASRGELIGKATFEPSELEPAGGAGFQGFSRTPYIGTFHRGRLAMMLVSVHSFFGDEGDPVDMGRRLGETKAIGWWCQRQSRDAQAYTKDILALGDFNTPSEDDMPLAEQLLDELRRKGLYTPRYTPHGNAPGEDTVLETQIGTAVRSENHYDQLLFFPKDSEADLVDYGVFDFDAVIFPEIWNSPRRTRTDFTSYVVWAISDHRPMWAQFDALS